MELEFLYSARSLADRLEKQRLMGDLFGCVSMAEIAATAERERLTVLCEDRDYLTVATVTGQPVKLVTDV